MSHPDDQILVDLAINGSDAAHAPLSARDHVASCAVCSSTVADLRRTLSFASTSTADAAWVPPPPSVWERITAQIDGPSAAASIAYEGPAPADLPPRSASGRDGGSRLPDSPTSEPGASGHAVSDHAVSDHAVSGQAVSGHTASDHREPVAAPTPLERRRDRREREADRRPRLVGAAAGIAAAGLVVGLLTGRALWNGPTAPPTATQSTSAATTVSQVALNTLDTSDPKRLGEAAVVRTASGYELRVDTTNPVDAGSGYLEVWLINRDLKRMVSIGVLRGSGVASFPISQNLIDQGYVVVDISRQQFIESNAHSGDSVMRGELPA